MDDKLRITAYEASRAVYTAAVRRQKSGERLSVSGVPEGYLVTGYYDDPLSGFLGVRLSPSSGTASEERPEIFAVAGTQLGDGPRDVFSLLALGRPQMRSPAFREMLAAATAAGKQGFPVLCTGHSLGGGNSQFAAEAVARAAGTTAKVRSINFNPMGARPQIEEEFGLRPDDPPRAEVENWAVDGDVIPLIVQQHGPMRCFEPPAALARMFADGGPVADIRATLGCHFLTSFQSAFDEGQTFAGTRPSGERPLLLRIASAIGATQFASRVSDLVLSVWDMVSARQTSEKARPQGRLQTVDDIRTHLLDLHRRHGREAGLPVLLEDGAVKAAIGFYGFVREGGGWTLVHAATREGLEDGARRVAVGWSDGPPGASALRSIALHQAVFARLVLDRFVLYKSPTAPDEWVSSRVAYRVADCGGDRPQFQATAHGIGTGGRFDDRDGTIKLAPGESIHRRLFRLVAHEDILHARRDVQANFLQNVVRSVDGCFRVFEKKMPLGPEDAHARASAEAAEVVRQAAALAEECGRDLTRAVAAAMTQPGARKVDPKAIGAMVGEMAQCFGLTPESGTRPLPFGAVPPGGSAARVEPASALPDFPLAPLPGLGEQHLRDSWSDPLELACGAVVETMPTGDLVVRRADGTVAQYSGDQWDATWTRDQRKVSGVWDVASDYADGDPELAGTHGAEPALARPVVAPVAVLAAEDRAGRVVEKQGWRLEYGEDGKLVGRDRICNAPVKAARTVAPGQELEDDYAASDDGDYTEGPAPALV